MDLDAERFLVSALKGMSGLTSFRWTRTPSLINRNREDDVWITLANYCPSLNVIDREKPYEPLLEESDDPAYQRLSHNPNDLKSFSFKTEALITLCQTLNNVQKCSSKGVRTWRSSNLIIFFMRILAQNPYPRHFSFGPPWNSLREITLFGFNFISTELSTHLVSYPTIEILSVICCNID